MTEYGAIPTIYKGIRFRSRIEATWAAFFDQLGWPWQYEPLDLQGYIPDFILPMPLLGKHVLIEVKPALTLEELREHTAKIEASGWSDLAVVVGANLISREPDTRLLGLAGVPPGRDEDGWRWAPTDPFSLCVFCQAILPTAPLRCPLCNVLDERFWDFFRKAGYPWKDVRADHLDRLWAEAKNITQWRPPA